MAKKKEQPVDEFAPVESVTEHAPVEPIERSQLSLINALAHFVDREWYTNADGLQEQVFALDNETLEEMRRLCNG